MSNDSRAARYSLLSLGYRTSVMSLACFLENIGCVDDPAHADYTPCPGDAIIDSSENRCLYARSYSRHPAADSCDWPRGASAQPRVYHRPRTLAQRCHADCERLSRVSMVLHERRALQVRRQPSSLMESSRDCPVARYTTCSKGGTATGSGPAVASCDSIPRVYLGPVLSTRCSPRSRPSNRPRPLM